MNGNLMRRGLLSIAAWVLASCGGSGGTGMMSPPANTPSTPQGCSNCGTAMVSMTDAPGDFISYMVDVVSLKLKRSDGTLVEAVPVVTQVDFAQLVNLSEIVSADQIPSGTYVSAAITLDFGSATIVVDNGAAGVTIAAGSVINGATSMPLAAPNSTQMTLNLDLGSHNQLMVTPHAIANLALDFNLAASNIIAPSNTDPMTVTVNPVLTAGLAPDASKQIRVRGSLVSVDAAAMSYTVNVHPFFDSSGESGQFTVNTTNATSFSINNMSFTGGAGLTQLAALAAGAMVVAYGGWDRTTQSFTASNVLAGSSVPGIMHDTVEGTVLSRTGNTLAVANGLIFRVGMEDLAYARQVAVTLGSGTRVSEDGRSDSLSIQNISVGQHLQLSGTLGKDGSGAPTLDATAGSARLMLTSVSGTVVSLGTNLVTIDLNAIDGLVPASFDFAGTGSGAAQDAAAAAYSVGVPASLATTSLGSGAPVRFAGFVAPFGQAPPDFNASTQLSFASARSLLDLQWPASGSTAPFATLSSTQLLIDHSELQTTTAHYIRTGIATVDPGTLPAGLTLIPDPRADSLWLSIGHSKSQTSENFAAFTDFTAALNMDLNGSSAVVHIAAGGTYEPSSGTLSVDQMIVLIND